MGELIVTPAVVHPSTFSNILSSEITGPIKVKLHIETPNGPGHMTKIAAMPIYGKTHFKIFPRTRRPMTLGLVV